MRVKTWRFTVYMKMEPEATRIPEQIFIFIGHANNFLVNKECTVEFWKCCTVLLKLEEFAEQTL